MTLVTAGQIAVQGVFYSALGFVAVVSFFWPWWKSQLGWSIAAKSVAIALAVFPTVLYYWFGPRVYAEDPWLGWVTVAGLAFIPPILAWRAVVIWHAQRRARDMI